MATNRDKYNAELLAIVEGKKKEWADNIKGITPLLRSQASDMTDANALALSYRMMLLEEMSYFLNELSQESKIIKEKRSDKFIFYTTGLLADGNRPTGKLAAHPLAGHSKLSGTNKDMVISADLSDYEYTYEILSQMVDYLRECIKTIDQTLYAIKNRLELFNLLK